MTRLVRFGLVGIAALLLLGCQPESVPERVLAEEAAGNHLIGDWTRNTDSLPPIALTVSRGDTSFVATLRLSGVQHSGALVFESDSVRLVIAGGRTVATIRSQPRAGGGIAIGLGPSQRYELVRVPLD